MSIIDELFAQASSPAPQQDTTSQLALIQALMQHNNGGGGKGGGNGNPHGKQNKGGGPGRVTSVRGISRQPLKNVIIRSASSAKGRRLLDTYKGVTLQPNALLSLIKADKATKGNLFGMGDIGSYRDWAAQVKVYHDKPGLAAPPGTSYHQKGLAIDAGGLSSAVQHYLLHHGWNQFSHSTEPWHYSYHWTG